MKVQINDELDVTTSGIGTVRYKGSPSVTSHVVVSGDIVDSN